MTTLNETRGWITPGLNNSLQWFDYVIFSLTIATSVGIGLYHGVAARRKNTQNYFRGNQKFNIFAAGVSMFMSFFSGVFILGTTAEMYLWGVQLLLMWIGVSVSFTLVALLFVPLLFQLNLTSAFEYFEMRFGSKAARLTGAVLTLISQVIYMGAVMYSPATALEAVTGIPTWASILATGVVATSYTSVGGITAVIWTDVFQGIVMLVGIVTAVILASLKTGGVAKILEIAQKGGRLSVSFDPDPTLRLTFWSAVVSRVVSGANLFGLSQTGVQRYCAVPTVRKAQLSVLLNVPLTFVAFALVGFCGLVIYAYYDSLGCDPLQTGQIKNANQLFPYFILHVLQVPALPGILVAVLFSGALSNLSSSLNSLSAVTWKDFLERRYNKISHFKKAVIVRILVVAYGLLAISFAFLVKYLGTHVFQISLTLYLGTASPILGMFILGACFPWSNWIGAVVGGWSSLVFTLFLSIGSYISNPHQVSLPTNVHSCSALGFNVTRVLPKEPAYVFPLFKMSFLWISPLGTLACVVIGLLVSFATGAEKASEQNPAHVIPIGSRLFCCLPKTLQRLCGCGVNHERLQPREIQPNKRDVESPEEIPLRSKDWKDENEQAKHSSKSGVCD